MNGKTHFGFQEVNESDKAHRVAGVFDSVAPKYDLMNDLMSAGMHRAWKAFTIALARVRTGERVLDVASGSGDGKAFARRAGAEGEVWVTDINRAMLARGRDRLPMRVARCRWRNAMPSTCVSRQLFRLCQRRLRAAQHDAQGSGAHRDAPRAQAGRADTVLEFSRVWQPLSRAYDWYSFKVLPWLGPGLRATPTATAIWPNPSACTPTRSN
jgi:demethylmenaquinone methyltransferase/2-methoxy-6-polyprenyl-1,4-benzoquinol methylase